MDSIPLDNIGVVGLVVLLGWMLATGRLVTRREADEIRRDRDEWRRAWEAASSDAQSSSAQVAELLEHARVADATLRALSQVAASRESP